MDFNIFTISEVFPLIHNLLLSRPRREFRIRIYQYFYIEWREGGREGGYQSKQTSPNNSIYISTPVLYINVRAEKKKSYTFLQSVS